MADAKTYKAFLSYASADRRTGKWLHGRLEAYRVPKRLRRDRSDLPKRLRPIFRDREELSGGGVLNRDHAELRNLRLRKIVPVNKPSALLN